MINLYFPHPLCKLMAEKGLESETGMWWQEWFNADDHESDGWHLVEEMNHGNIDIPAYLKYEILMPENAKKWWPKVNDYGNAGKVEEWRFKSQKYLDLIQSKSTIEELGNYLRGDKK